MKSRFIIYSISLIICGLMVACGGKKKSTNSDSGELQNVNATTTNAIDEVFVKHFSKVMSNKTNAQNLVAKVHVSLALNDKELSTSGTLRMKKDDVIQLSLVDPLLGLMELGKMEFTEDKVLVVVRLKKMYVEVPYSKVSFLKQANVDFNSLQALFWNEVFEPGYFNPDANSYTYENDNENINLKFTDKLLAYKFITNEKSGLLTKTEITGSKDNSYKLWFDYAGFTSFEKKQFPQNITLSFTDSKNSTSLKMELSNLKNTSGWETRTSVPNGYDKAEFESIFKSLMNN